MWLGPVGGSFADFFASTTFDRGLCCARVRKGGEEKVVLKKQKPVGGGLL